jgi:hypothetical protein
MRSATLCLAGTAILLLSTPALAGASTRAERDATRQLNLDQQRAAETANQSLRPQFADASAGRPLGSPPAAAPTTPIATRPIATTPIESAAIANPDGEAPVALSTITTPPAQLATAKVLDASGQTVGAVQRVDLGANGAPAQVSVALIGGGDKLLVLDAGQVKYDPVRNAVLAAESAERMKAMAQKG